MFYRACLFFTMLITLLNASDDIKNLKTFQANFIQTITSSSQNIIKYEGEVFIKNSGKILWKYKSPIIKNVYIDNRAAIVDEPDLEQAIFTQLESEINIIDLINSSKKITNNKYTSEIDGILYTILTQDNKIEKIIYKDTLDNSVEIVFFDSTINQNIDDSLFIFKLPSNYDLIRK